LLAEADDEPVLFAVFVTVFNVLIAYFGETTVNKYDIYLCVKPNDNVTERKSFYQLIMLPKVAASFFAKIREK
jgi:hypothetical protein